MLSKNLISSVLVQIPVFALGVISGVFSTRFLGNDAKGVFALFQANSQLLTLLFSFSIQTGIIYFISSGKLSQAKVAGMSVFVLLCGLLAVLILITLIHFLGLTEVFLTKEFESYQYVFVLFLFYFFSFANSIMGAFLQAHSMFKTTNMNAFIYSASNAIIFGSLYFIFMNETLSLKLKVDYMLYVSLGSTILNTLLWIYYYKKYINVKPDLNFEFRSQLRPFLLYNSAIFLGTLINFMNYRLDLWIVNYFLSEQDLSYYSLAANINQIIIYISVTIGTVMLPNLSGKEEAERVRTFTQISRISFSFFIILILFAFFISDLIIPFIYGHAFEPTIVPFKLILPGVLFSCNTQLLATLIVSSKKNILNIIATAIGLVVTAGLDLVLIPSYGILGASVATSISYMVIFISTFYLSLKKLNMPLTNYFLVNKQDLKLIGGQLRALIK